MESSLLQSNHTSPSAIQNSSVSLYSFSSAISPSSSAQRPRQEQLPDQDHQSTLRGSYSQGNNELLLECQRMLQALSERDTDFRTSINSMMQLVNNNSMIIEQTHNSIQDIRREIIELRQQNEKNFKYLMQMDEKIQSVSKFQNEQSKVTFAIAKDLNLRYTDLTPNNNNNNNNNSINPLFAGMDTLGHSLNIAEGLANSNQNSIHHHHNHHHHHLPQHDNDMTKDTPVAHLSRTNSDLSHSTVSPSASGSNAPSHHLISSTNGLHNQLGVLVDFAGHGGETTGAENQGGGRRGLIQHDNTKSSNNENNNNNNSGSSQNAFGLVPNVVPNRHTNNTIPNTASTEPDGGDTAAEAAAAAAAAVVAAESLNISNPNTASYAETKIKKDGDNDTNMTSIHESSRTTHANSESSGFSHGYHDDLMSLDASHFSTQSFDEHSLHHHHHFVKPIQNTSSSQQQQQHNNQSISPHSAANISSNQTRNLSIGSSLSPTSINPANDNNNNSNNNTNNNNILSNNHHSSINTNDVKSQIPQHSNNPITLHTSLTEHGSPFLTRTTTPTQDHQMSTQNMSNNNSLLNDSHDSHLNHSSSVPSTINSSKTTAVSTPTDSIGSLNSDYPMSKKFKQSDSPLLTPSSFTTITSINKKGRRGRKPGKKSSSSSSLSKHQLLSPSLNFNTSATSSTTFLGDSNLLSISSHSSSTNLAGRVGGGGGVGDNNAQSSSTSTLVVSPISSSSSSSSASSSSAYSSTTTTSSNATSTLSTSSQITGKRNPEDSIHAINIARGRAEHPDAEYFELNIEEIKTLGSFKEAYLEFTEGIRGKPSIKEQEKYLRSTFGTHYFIQLKQARSFRRRKTLVTLIDKLRDYHNCTLDEACQKLERFRSENKKTISWVCNHLPPVDAL